jgi:DNA topoisomerase-1
MRVAQDLYESGAITYIADRWRQMAADADPLARSSLSALRPAQRASKPRIYETKAKNAQEAHEAIRPTDFDRDRYGSADAPALRTGLEARARQQMESARLERTTVRIADETGAHALRATARSCSSPASSPLRGRP